MMRDDTTATTLSSDAAGSTKQLEHSLAPLAPANPAPRAPATPAPLTHLPPAQESTT